MEEEEAVNIPLCGESAVEPWLTANVIAIDTYPWRTDGAALSATARLLYDEEALYLQYQVNDDAIRATPRDLNGAVWKDSCVELFASPRPDIRHYFNFEANCLGDFRIGYGPDRNNRRVIPPHLAKSVRVESSISGSEPSLDDDEWWLAAALPFEMLGEFVGADVAPSAGTAWRGNVHCCREGDDPRFAVWNLIDVPKPDFHQPASFGRLVFG